MKDLFIVWIGFSVISASFWLIAFLSGFIALAIYSALKESVGHWFLIIYRAALAAFFASIMVVPVILMRQNGYSWGWYIFAFIFFYFSLSSAYYEDRSDIGAIGYTAGLVSFPIFAIFPELAFNTITLHFFQAISWIITSWVGVLIGIYVLYKLGSYILGVGFTGIILLFMGIWSLKNKTISLMSGKRENASAQTFKTGEEVDENESFNSGQEPQAEQTINNPDHASAENISIEGLIDEATDEIEEKRSVIAELSEELASIKNELAFFEAEYHGRIGVLYIRIDELELAIKEYRKRVELIKEGRIKNLVDLEKKIEEQFKGDYEKIGEEKEEARQYTEEYEAVKEKPRLDKESEKRLKSLYRELAKKYHPDMAATPEEKERFHKIMAEINQAYNDRDLQKLEALAMELEAPEKIVFEETLEEKYKRLLHESEQLDAIISKLEGEFDAIKDSDTYNFKIRVGEAEKEGKDLLQEMEDNLNAKIQQKAEELEKVKREFKNIAKGLA